MAQNSEPREQNIWHILFTFVFLALFAYFFYVLYSAGKLNRAVPVFDFIVLALAIFRLTHLFVFDHIMHWAREYFRSFQKGPGKTMSDLLSCPWCTGMWVSLFVLFFYFYSHGAWYFILVLALAGLASFFETTSLRLARK